MNDGIGEPYADYSQPQKPMQQQHNIDGGDLTPTKTTNYD
jgi:hypothetical protein